MTNTPRITTVDTNGATEMRHALNRHLHLAAVRNADWVTWMAAHYGHR
jgi:hypothetical protein